MTNEHKQSLLFANDLLNILKLQAALLYSIYHQRIACKTSLVHRRGSISRILILVGP